MVQSEGGHQSSFYKSMYGTHEGAGMPSCSYVRQVLFYNQV